MTYSQNKLTRPVSAERSTYWMIILLGLALDLLTKSLAFGYLDKQPGYTKPVLGSFFALTARVNNGGAFSIAAGNTWLLVTVSVVAVLAAVVMFELGCFKGRMLIPAAMFTAGAAGNLYDRLFNQGLVRDFFDINLYVNNYHWPTFNIADSLMCISIAIIIVFSIIDEAKGKKDGKTT
ncbi:MAG: signal peptidase II [Phycisphaerae bacterium]|jgi:signal peptidase II